MGNVLRLSESSATDVGVLPTITAGVIPASFDREVSPQFFECFRADAGHLVDLIEGSEAPFLGPLLDNRAREGWPDARDALEVRDAGPVHIELAAHEPGFGADGIARSVAAEN